MVEKCVGTTLDPTSKGISCVRKRETDSFFAPFFMMSPLSSDRLQYLFFSRPSHQFSGSTRLSLVARSIGHGNTPSLKTGQRTLR
jgi:hypothetical protein